MKKPKPMNLFYIGCSFRDQSEGKMGILYSTGSDGTWERRSWADVEFYLDLKRKVTIRQATKAEMKEAHRMFKDVT